MSVVLVFVMAGLGIVVGMKFGFWSLVIVTAVLLTWCGIVTWGSKNGGRVNPSLSAWWVGSILGLAVMWFVFCAQLFH